MEIVAPDTRPRAAVLVIHSWWGLTPSFRRYGTALSRAGYLVGLADLFDGATAETEAEARRLRSRPRRVPMYRQLGADLETLRARLGGETAPVGLVGFSMGGHWAVWLSQRPEYGIAATILYYAARGGSFASCRARIQAHFAETDDWVSASARKSMERSIARAGCDYRGFDYPGTGHWFAESDRTDTYDAACAARALKRDRDFLAETLRR
ncbi:dienelactone hydrolase family protein [Thalassococcus sp. CAU 1522]|uniref:Dienelactone hydrolase family protein n=1 Tax=Thalassococcus arenae TaxID=2851652 RepID=A0ABS6N8S6_9RHOB|nr:dienelactone hydrolase family protein [Thalassococcus arenae]MBV2360402.1 dienelactone hydrolase family protein [Thalassococcus arenae]